MAWLGSILGLPTFGERRLLTELRRMRVALERIADAQESAAGEGVSGTSLRSYYQGGNTEGAKIYMQTDEELWKLEQAEAAMEAAGVAPAMDDPVDLESIDQEEE